MEGDEAGWGVLYERRIIFNKNFKTGKKRKEKLN